MSKINLKSKLILSTAILFSFGSYTPVAYASCLDLAGNSYPNGTQGGNDVIICTGHEAGSFNTRGGNDTVTMVAGSDTDGRMVVGDGNDILTLTSTNIGTYIDGEAGDDVISVTDSIIGTYVGAGNGSDMVTITGTTIGTYINLGSNTSNDGADTLILTNSSVGSYIDAGFGNDVLTITNSTIGGRVAGERGDDTIEITGGSVGGNVEGNDGADTLTISGVSIGGNIRLGQNVSDDGADILTITNSSVGSFIEAGFGNDMLTITNTVIGGRVAGERGDDTIIITGGSTGGHVDGNDGDDTITINGTAVGGNVEGADGSDTLMVNNATVTGQVFGGAADDVITVTGGSLIDGDVNGGAGNDIINVIGGSQIGLTNGLGERSLEGGAGDDIVTIDGTINGNVDLEAGDDTIVLNGNTVINTTREYDVIGGTGNDSITINGGTFLNGVNAEEGADTIIMNGGSVEQINGGNGADIINIFGGTVTNTAGSFGVRAGAGDDVLTVDSTQSLTALNLRAVTRFDGDVGSDTAIFNNVTSGVEVGDNFSFTQWNTITFSNSTINLSDSTFINMLALTNGSTLNQVDGDLNLGNGTILTVDGTSVVNMQDGAVGDVIHARYNPAAGSTLMVDVDVTARGYSANDSDYIMGAIHTPTAGALVNTNILGAADLSGSRRIVDGGAPVNDPGVGATPTPSAFYALTNDPSTGSRKFWLQDDGQGGTYLLWTTPVSGATMSSFFGGGTLIAGTGPNDPNYAVDTSGKGAGMNDIAMMSGGMDVSSNIGDMSSANAGETSGSNGQTWTCEADRKTNAWVSGTISGSSFGTTDGDTQNVTIGIERDVSNAFSKNCGRAHIGAFAYFGKSDFEMPFGSTSDIDSNGFGAYLRGNNKKGFYGSVLGYVGDAETRTFNSTLNSTSDSDTDVWGLAANVGKVTPMQDDLDLDVRAFAALGSADTNTFTDSNALTVDGIEGETLNLGANVAMNKTFSTNVGGFVRVGGKYTKVDSTLNAYGLSVDSKPSYTVATGEIGLRSRLGESGSFKLSGFGEFGDDVEVYGAKARLSYKF